MRSYYLILIFFLLVKGSFAQNSLPYFPSSKLIECKDSSQVVVSERPITNRDYLTYLFYCDKVFGDYPKVLQSAMPVVSQEVSSKIADERYRTPYTYFLDLRLKYSNPFVRNYMFNAKYLDYPVVGLNRNQIFRFNKWLTDRYNEYHLQQLGLDSFHFGGQSPGFNFNTEALVYDQYRSIYNPVKFKISWQEHKLIPCFRLMTMQEAKRGRLKSIKFKSYSSSSLEFLKPWSDYFIKTANGHLIMNTWYSWVKNDTLNYSSKRGLEIVKNVMSEVFLDIRNEECSSVKQCLAANGFPVLKEIKLEKGVVNYKDSVGSMPFIMIGYDSLSQPVFMLKDPVNNSSSENFIEYSAFRAGCGLSRWYFKED